MKTKKTTAKQRLSVTDLADLAMVTLQEAGASEENAAKAFAVAAGCLAGPSNKDLVIAVLREAAEFHFKGNHA